MDLNLSFFTVLVSVFIILLTLFKFKGKKSSNLPPGPRRMPLIGNLHLFVTSRAVHRIITDLSQKYGSVMRLQFGEVITIVVSSSDIAKQVLKTQCMAFEDRPPFPWGEILSYDNTNIAFAPYGDYWRQLRKICTLELLSNRRVQSFRPLRESEFMKLCRWISSSGGSSIHLTEKVESSMCDTAMLAVLGKTTGELATYISLAKDASGLLAMLCILDMYPSMTLLRRMSGLRGRVEKVHTSSDAILEKIINDHKESKAKGREQEDLVDVLLKFNEPGHELYLTTDNIKAVVQDLIVSGFETASTVVDWAMAEMLRNPRVLKKAQEEIRQVFKDKGFVSESECDQLTYLKFVIKESMRMHPPTPLLLPRVSYEPCKIGGYEVPGNTRVMVNVWAMGRDPKYWKEPEKFMPERYLDNNVDFIGNHYEFLPFGGGRRICPGMTFAVTNILLMLAMLLFHFDWVLPDGKKPEDVDMVERFGLSVRRKNPLDVVPVVRIPVPMK